VSEGYRQMVLVLLPVIVGAGLAVVPTLLVERVRQRATLLTRWDPALHTACAEFAATARRVLRLSNRIAGQPASADTRSALILEIYDEHARLSGLMEQIWLLSRPDLQRATRLVIRHAAALRQYAISGTDPYGDDSTPPPEPRFNDAIIDFYRAARRELQIQNADDIASRDP
jgi:hypothetical protein